MGANLFASLAKAQAAARAVEKSATNSFHRYKYASAEAVIEESRHALAGSGLALLPTRYAVERRDEGMMLVARYALTHESGEKLELDSETPIIPEKGRPEDKATATAKTFDLAYLLRGLLLLPRVEEGTEADERDDSKYEPRRQQKPAERRPEAKEIQQEAKQADPPAKSKIEQWRDSWVSILGAQLFADAVGCDPKDISKYAPPKEKAKRDALTATLEAARRDIEALGANA